MYNRSAGWPVCYAFYATAQSTEVYGGTHPSTKKPGIKPGERSLSPALWFFLPTLARETCADAKHIHFHVERRPHGSSCAITRRPYRVVCDALSRLVSFQPASVFSLASLIYGIRLQ
jgi:hypothetical protein